MADRITDIESQIDAEMETITNLLTLQNSVDNPFIGKDSKYGQRFITADLNIDELTTQRLRQIFDLITPMLEKYHALRDTERELLKEARVERINRPF